MFTLQQNHSCANLILELLVFALIKRIMTVMKTISSSSICSFRRRLLLVAKTSVLAFNVIYIYILISLV